MKSKKLFLTRLGLRFPIPVILALLALTTTLTLQFPKVKFDNNPENMLEYDEPVRKMHRDVKARYELYDFVVVGVVNKTHPQGAWNPATLARIHTLTHELLSLTRTPEGRPAVLRDGKLYSPDLQPKGGWAQLLATAFQQDAERLFTPEGKPGLITEEIIAPSVVDTIRQLDQGALDIRFLMETPPVTQAEADALFAEASANPLYRDTLLSEDRNAIGIYLPILEKTFSYNVSKLVEHLTRDWPAEDVVYITGLPVAEDTFGHEMLIQMATSAPMAGLMIFLLLLFFFKRLSLIIAPMIIAIVSVLCTMGLLIGMGYDVHIMSSMIAIFLMPISVADSVHILSEFFDSYPRFQDKRKTIEHIMAHLFMPMLFTSLTTIAGFASLATTPIPPVRVFGLFVAFGVALAWVLSVLFTPAYILLFVSEKSLSNLSAAPSEKPHKTTILERFMTWIGIFSIRHRKGVVGVVVLLAVLSGFGIARIVVNDNPVLWFTPSHRIRVADKVLNHHFGGTYPAYLELRGPELAVANPKTNLPSGLSDELSLLAERGGTWEQIFDTAGEIDDKRMADWNALADVVQYLDAEGLDWTKLVAATDKIADVVRTPFLAKADAMSSLRGEELITNALQVIDALAGERLEDQVRALRVNAEAPAFKRPDVLRWVEALQAHMASVGKIGKSSSAVDALKKAHLELRRGKDGMDEERFYRVPDTASAAGEVFLQLEGMKKKDSLFHMVSRDYNDINLWLQLSSGDNQNMIGAKEDVERWMAANPPPVALERDWAGLTYLNVVWQDRMVTGMMESLASSFVVVLLMMIFLFRSWKFGLLSMIPLSLTIGLTYGLIGWMGKAYDMPVAVLSSLTLGLSVDFAIHFLERARELVKEHGSWEAAAPLMFREPARAISLNAIIIAVGFTPLLLAPLMPYKTVGFFLATIMFVSWLATLFILAAIISLKPKWLFK